eukprot:s352_g41.t2
MAFQTFPPCRPTVLCCGARVQARAFTETIDLAMKRDGGKVAVCNGLHMHALVPEAFASPLPNNKSPVSPSIALWSREGARQAPPLDTQKLLFESKSVAMPMTRVDSGMYI